MLDADPLHEPRIRADAGVVVEAARRRRLAPRRPGRDEAAVAGVEPDPAARTDECEEARARNVRPTVAVCRLELRAVMEHERLVVPNRSHLVPERLGDARVVLEEEDIRSAVPEVLDEV